MASSCFFVVKHIVGYQEHIEIHALERSHALRILVKYRA